MPEPTEPGRAADPAALQAEIARLNKIVQALMNRVERSANLQGSDFSMFQASVMVEERVRRRTWELEEAMRENDRITRALKESEGKFRTLVSQSLVGITIAEDGCITYVNPRFADIFGYTVDEMMHMPMLHIVNPGDRPIVIEQVRRRLSGEADRVDYRFEGLRKDGSVVDIECHGSVMHLDGKPAFISMMVDVTQRTRAEREILKLQERLQLQAIHDPLTNLYNRLPLNEFFDRELSLARRHRRQVNVVMADMDSFKRLNDTYGHLAGDEVLRGFSGLLRTAYRSSDLCCRFGGEEFLVLLPDMTQEAARKRTMHLRQTLAATPIFFGSSTIHVTASFGIATYPTHGLTREALISAADEALYAAKRSGRNAVVTASELHQPIPVTALAAIAQP